ncbi:hypothetical protein KVF89_15535 [Nocardioides carbamazepini]|uniref:hypothetical protein n=1 Tax=Nocardioides carbamazepini TaxID=2854259 RepID=UPI002149D76E|nr:hypothetical protein [Nocardioides carbamazepini]MCR1783953.1 hypothetical protein [Nocardioides carbamazepini]
MHRSSDLDDDSREVIAQLRRVVAASGLTQSQFAFAVGSRPGRFSEWLSGTVQPVARAYVRCLRLGQALAAVAERNLLSTPTAALAIRKSVRRGEIEHAWATVLAARAQLRAAMQADDTVTLDAWNAAPVPTDSLEWDTLLAAVVGHEFERAGRAAPTWCAVDPLPRSWRPLPPQVGQQRGPESTPAWLRRLRIRIPEADLAEPACPDRRRA